MPAERTCEHCGQQFRITRKREEGRKFCGEPCHRAHETLHGRPAAQTEAVVFHCKECSAPFSMKPSYVKAYRKKFNKDPLYCSMPCSDKGRRKDADERHKTNCKNCGKEFYKTRLKGSGTLYREQMLCSKQCKNEWTSKVYRQKHGLPQTTRRIKRKYSVLRIPAQNGKPAYEILEHRHVMARHLGRELFSEETVHHINGDRFNNDLSNLELFSSRHGPGQRIIDKVQFAIDMLKLYPEFAGAVGYKLVAIEPHVTDADSREPR